MDITNLSFCVLYILSFQLLQIQYMAFCIYNAATLTVSNEILW